MTTGSTPAPVACSTILTISSLSNSVVHAKRELNDPDSYGTSKERARLVKILTLESNCAYSSSVRVQVMR